MTFGVGNGVRTRDLLNGNQILYQLSYTHIWYLRSQRRSSALVPHPTSPPPGYLWGSTVWELFIYVGIWNQLRRVVRTTGFEPVTPWV